MKINFLLVHNPRIDLMLVPQLLVLNEQFLGDGLQPGQLTLAFAQLTVQVVSLFKEDVIATG